MLKNRITIFAFTTLIFTLCACGIKGPPLPPISEETIQKQKQEELQASEAKAAAAKAASADETTAKPVKKKTTK